MSLQIATAQRPAHGEMICGDAFAIVTAADAVVIALADGLGHGPRAYEAAEGFCDYVRSNHKHSLEQILRGAGAAISGTRGAIAVVMRLETKVGAMEFAGVGNIETQVLSRSAIRPVCTPGIVGRPLRKVITWRYEISAGDLLAVYSDGISPRFDLESYRQLEPQLIADSILERHGKSYDDATILVIRV